MTFWIVSFCIILLSFFITYWYVLVKFFYANLIFWNKKVRVPSFWKFHLWVTVATSMYCFICYVVHCCHKHSWFCVVHILVILLRYVVLSVKLKPSCSCFVCFFVCLFVCLWIAVCMNAVDLKLSIEDLWITCLKPVKPM